MTTMLKSVLIGGALVLASATAASSADLYGGGGSVKDHYASPMPVGPSWYVRIDGGYAAHDEPDMTEAGIYTLFDTDIDNTWTLGGGIGRYFTPTIRGDVTYDHRFEADAQGTLRGHPDDFNGVRMFGIESDVVLFNLYYDFNRGGRFNPYVGVGLGVTHNTATAGTVSGDCGCDGIIEKGSETHVAGALMAGFTTLLRGGQSVVGGTNDGPMVVDSGRGLHLDVGYRFLYLGDVETGAVIANGDSIADDPTVEKIHGHEFRVGLRYDIR